MKSIKKVSGIVFLMTVLICCFVIPASAASIPTGYCQLSSALNGNMVVDIYGGNIKNEANIQLYNKNGGSNQTFYIKNVGSDWFTIAASTDHKMVLDVYGGQDSSRANRNVQLCGYNGGDNQLWKFETTDNGYYVIRSKLGLVLDVEGGRAYNEANLIIYKQNGGSNQKWKITSVNPPTGYYKLSSNLNENMVVDVYGNNIKDEANIQLYTQNNGSNQIFYIKDVGSNWFTIAAYQNTNKVLDVYGGSDPKRLNRNVQLCEYNGGDNQLWRFESVGAGYYVIKNKMGLVLDVEGGRAYNEANLIVYQSNNGQNQKWHLTPEKAPDPIPSNGLLFPLKGSITRSSTIKTNGQYCDYKAAQGTPIYAPADGKIEFKQAYAVNYNKLASYGNHIIFTSNDGYVVKMAHLSSFEWVSPYFTSTLTYPCGTSKYKCSSKSLGTRNVKQGDLIGYTGKTGNASGPHLHLELRQNGRALNPANTFKTW